MFAVVDCETTGLSRNARIVELSVILIDQHERKIVRTYNTLINPQCDTGPQHIHGISNSMVKGAPVFSEIAGVLTHLLDGNILVAHNLSFDSRMIKQEFDRIRVNFSSGRGYCTYKLTRLKLEKACLKYGVKLLKAHEALSDTMAAAELIMRFYDRLPEAEPVEIENVFSELNWKTVNR